MSTQRAVHRAVLASGRVPSVGHVGVSSALAGSPASSASQLLPHAQLLRHAWTSVNQAARPYACAGVRRYSTTPAPLGRSSHATRPPTRGPAEDAEWDRVRKSRDPFLTTLDPATTFPTLPPNEREINQLSFRYGLPPLPALGERIQQYNVEQSYYDRRDRRIRDHLNRLLRMKKLSKREMLILIDQLENSHWDLRELQSAYLPEVRHALQDERAIHMKALRVGVGGTALIARYKKQQEEKAKRRTEKGVIPPNNGDGTQKYGYRKDLVNMGPERQLPSAAARTLASTLSAR